MKKIALLLLFVFCYFGVTLRASAQVQQVLISTEFSNDEQMDMLFENSQRVLIYTEGGNIDLPVVLSLSTRTQIQTLEKNGLKPTIIDQNPDISRYVLLYNPKADQSDVLKSYGEAFVISDYYTLLKVPSGQKFVHEGPAAKFFLAPFTEEVVRPPKDIVVTPNLSLTPQDIPSTQKSSPVIAIAVGAIIIGAIVGIVVIYRLIKKKRDSSQPQF